MTGRAKIQQEKQKLSRFVPSLAQSTLCTIHLCLAFSASVLLLKHCSLTLGSYFQSLSSKNSRIYDQPNSYPDFMSMSVHVFIAGLLLKSFLS